MANAQELKQLVKDRYSRIARGEQQADEAIRRIVRDVAAKQFPGHEVVSVQVAYETDEDGDPILVLTLVMAPEARVLEPRKASGFARHMRSRLAEIGEHRFPLLSFVSASDLGRGDPAAA